MEYQITIETKSTLDNFIDELKERIAQHEDVTECTVHSYGYCGQCKHRKKSPFCEEGGYCPDADDDVAEDDFCETGNFEPKESEESDD